MDLSEQAVAALLAEEASRLRQAAGFQGYSAFLQKPSVRARPNKQFLAATVRNVESANRTAQVSEMWHLRRKELSKGEASDGKAGCISRTIKDRNDRNYTLKNNVRNNILTKNTDKNAKRVDIDDANKNDIDKYRNRDDERNGNRIGRDAPRDSQRGVGISQLAPGVFPASVDRAASEKGPSISAKKNGSTNRGEDRNGRSLGEGSVRESSDPSASSDGSHEGRVKRKQGCFDVRRGSSNEAEPIGPSTAQAHDSAENEIDEFLHSRKKRGRGTIGSRIDEPGPFAAAVDREQQDERDPSSKVPVVLGPQLPADLEEQRRRKKRREMEMLEGEERPRKRKKGDRTEDEKRARKEEKRKRKLEKERLREKRRLKRRSRDG